MSWTIVKELKEKQAKAFADAKSVRELAHKEDRDLTADELKRHDSLLTDCESYKARIDREERANAFGEASNAQKVREATGETICGVPSKELKRYSLLRVVRAQMEHKALDGFEAEVSKEIERIAGKSPRGAYIPLMDLRTLSTSTGTGAVGIHLETTAIDLLRNQMVMTKLGASFITGMVGKFSIPRQNGAGTGYWISSEGGAPTISNQTLDQVAFVPNTVGAYTDITRQFATQSSVDAESFVRNDLLRVVGLKLDLAAIHGAGSSGEPTGITVAASTSSVSHGTNGGAPTWAKVVEFEKDVLSANGLVDPNGGAYLTNAKVSSVLKTTDKTSGGYGQFIVAENNAGKLNGYPLVVTNAVKSDYTKACGSSLSGMIFGDFSQVVIATWGGMDMTVDPYTGSSSGTLRIVVLQDADVELRHPESFAVAKDIIA